MPKINPRIKSIDDLLGLDAAEERPIEPTPSVSLPTKNTIITLPPQAIRAFRGHPFRLYEGDRLNDLVESIAEHGVLNPVIIRKIERDEDGFEYEMLAGHNRQNAAAIANRELPCIVKENLSDEDAWIYVIETNVLQRSFSEMLPSEKAAVLPPLFLYLQYWEDKSMNYMHIHPNDNVFVALEIIPAGTVVAADGYSVTALEEIPKGHKIAVKDIACGENIIKYGFPIGHAITDIPAGSWIHTHNIKTNLSGTLEYTYQPNLTPYPDFPEGKEATFDGYVRKNGDVGIRNEIWIVNTVGCVNRSAEALAREATKLYGDKVDGIYTFVHPFGCSQLGEDHHNTQQILADLVHHPNAGGVLVLSLGCENNNLSEFSKVLGDVDPERVRFLVTQDVEDELEAGLKIIGELV